MMRMIAGVALLGAALSPAHGQAMPAMPGMADMPGMTMAGGAYAAGSGTSRVPAQDPMQGLRWAPR